MNKNTKILIEIIIVTFNIIWIYFGAVLVATKNISLIVFLVCVGYLLYVTYGLIFAEIKGQKRLNSVQK